jgi:hypothetical protein
VRVRASDYFNHVAILNHRSERHHATVDARTGAGIPHFRVDHVREINGRRAPRQLNYSAHRREGINVLGIKIEFQRIDEFARVLDLLRPFDQGAQYL